MHISENELLNISSEELSAEFETFLEAKICEVLPKGKGSQSKRRKTSADGDNAEGDVQESKSGVGKKMLHPTTYSVVREYHRLWLQALTNEEVIHLQRKVDNQIYLEVRNHTKEDCIIFTTYTCQ